MSPYASKEKQRSYQRLWRQRKKEEKAAQVPGPENGNRGGATITVHSGMRAEMSTADAAPIETDLYYLEKLPHQPLIINDFFEWKVLEEPPKGELNVMRRNRQALEARLQHLEYQSVPYRKRYNLLNAMSKTRGTPTELKERRDELNACAMDVDEFDLKIRETREQLQRVKAQLVKLEGEAEHARRQAKEWGIGGFARLMFTRNLDSEMQRAEVLLKSATQEYNREGAPLDRKLDASAAMKRSDAIVRECEKRKSTIDAQHAKYIEELKRLCGE